MKPLALALTTLLFLSSCAAYRAQHAAPADAPSSASLPDPKVVATLQSEPLAVKQRLLISEIDRYIDDAKAAGQYDCCVTPACRQCAMTAGECHCREVVSSDGPCCGECTQAWIEGRGNIPGVDREQVLAHLGCVRELYEKKVPEGMTPPAQRKDQK